MSDWYWRVEGDGPWPQFDIDEEERLKMLEQWDEYWPGAMASLAAVEVPDEVGK